MAAGAVQFVFTAVSMLIDPLGSVLAVQGNAAKYITDDLGGQKIIDQFSATITYPLAGAGARTLASIKADLVTAMQASYAALSGKTIA